MLKILLLMEKGEPNGASWYRYVQFAKKANELGIADVQYIDLKLSEKDLTTVLNKADVYFSRVSSPVLPVVLKDDKRKKRVVIDMDDSLDDVDPLSDHYSGLGIKEVQLADGTYLWKDHVGGFNAWRNRMRVEEYKENLTKADALICTTFELKNYLEQFNKVCAVIPNAINFDLFPKVTDPLKRGKRLGWSGGSSHYSDLAELQTTLKVLMESNVDLSLYLYGVHFKGITKDLPQDRVITKGWVQSEAHGYRLACSDWDLGFCAIRDTTFNRMKSSVKYYELAALGVCTIARNIPPYSDDIVHGENGILYDSPQDFGLKVQEMLNDPMLRLRIGEAGYQYVRENRDLEKITREWVEFLEGVAHG